MKILITPSELGPRICIVGPSNSGKSTLAEAISHFTGLPPVHLDRLYHLPETDWMARANEEFLYLHKKAVHKERWVMDGNYLKCIDERLSRATGLIMLELPVYRSLLRYLIRCYSDHPRKGGLVAGREHASWRMLKHIAWGQTGNRRRLKSLYEEVTLPKLVLSTPQDVQKWIRQWRA